ncbi:MAG: alpha/beta fold hydrolase [bacterium]
MASRPDRKPPKGIVQEDFFIDALDPGVRLHLREKRPRGKRRFGPAATLLMVHGRMSPGQLAFDFPVSGRSWMDRLAARGFDVFTMSVRGFGLSTRPPELEADPAGKPPAIRGAEALRDIEAAVRFIRRRREVDRLNMLGRSWSTTLVPAFAAAHPGQVLRAALYAPYYAYDAPARAARFEDPARPGRWDPRRGAWSWTTEKDFHARWWGHIPGTAHHRWRDPRVVRAYWKELLRYDPEGARRRTPAIRLSNGSLADAYDRARNRPLYDAAKVRCPVLLIYGDRDGAANELEAWGLYRALTASREKRYVVIGEGTHFMELEKRREELFGEVESFLES